MKNVRIFCNERIIKVYKNATFCVNYDSPLLTIYKDGNLIAAFKEWVAVEHCV